MPSPMLKATLPKAIVAVRFVVRGHFGSTAVAIPIMNFFTVENGRITRDDGIFDNGGRACSA